MKRKVAEKELKIQIIQDSLKLKIAKYNIMRHNYALEKLGSAVHSMATDRGDIKTRLWHAYLIFHTLSAKDFSDEYNEDWNFIYNSLTTEEPSYDDKGEVTTGKVQNTLKILDEDTCVEIAERICNLESRIRYE